MSCVQGRSDARSKRAFQHSEAFAKAKRYVFEHLAAGEFKLRIDKTFAHSQIVEAHRYMESNQQIGKIVVTV
jgi:NADPH:quinone reductase-like Zn-dependent oxidoreductase